jgi:hypothetical protein
VRNEYKKGKKNGAKDASVSRNNKADMKKWVDLTLYVMMRIVAHMKEVWCVIGVYLYVGALVFGAL